MKFAYTIVYVSNVAASLDFYERAFGFSRRFLHESGEYGELDTGHTTLSFASHAMGNMNLDGKYLKSSASAAPLGIELAFSTEDVEAAYNKALAAGAISITAPAEKPWGQTVAYVRANEGELIELCSPMGE